VGAVGGALVILATSCLAALALQRMGASVHGDVPPGWPVNGCLSASVAPWRGPLGQQVVVGQASLCMTDSGLHATLDVAHLDPTARYTAWVAYFESPSLCSGGALMYQIRNFNRPCTLIDLAGAQPQGILRAVAETAADAQGSLHVDGPIREIGLRPHAQAWLLVSRPAWSPVPPPTNSKTHDNPSEPIAHAVFDLP
jgi:hypothetical protein